MEFEKNSVVLDEYKIEVNTSENKIDFYDLDGYFLGAVYPDDLKKDWGMILSGHDPISEKWEDGLGHTISMDGWFSEQMDRDEILNEIYSQRFASLNVFEFLDNYSHVEINDAVLLANNGIVSFNFTWHPDELFSSLYDQNSPDFIFHDWLTEKLSSDDEEFNNFCKEHCSEIIASFDQEFDESCKLIFEDCYHKFDHSNQKELQRKQEKYLRY